MEIDRENIPNLSDDQLFKTMKKCGLNVGPINKSTRSVYEKRLRNYLDGNSTISADLITTSREPVAVLTAASLNETFPRAKPEQKREEPQPAVIPPPKNNPEPKQSTLDDVVSRNTFVRPNEPTSRNVQSQSNGYSSSQNSHVSAPTSRNVQPQSNGYSSSQNSHVSAPTSTMSSNTAASARSSYEPLAKSVERKANELDFKLIKPATTINNFAPTSNTPTRRDVNYGLLDDKHTPSTLSSSYRLPESTTSAATSNIRSRNTNLTTNTTTNRMETQPVKPTSTTTTKSNEVASKGKSSFRWQYYLMILILFGIVYFGIVFNSNPENPVEFIN